VIYWFQILLSKFNLYRYIKVDFDQGIKHLKESLRLDPDHREAQGLHRRMKRAGAALEKGRAAVAKRDFDVAVVGLYTFNPVYP
jgi:hypothetical protein